MDLSAVTMSPPYDEEDEELFPDLLRNIRQIEGETSALLSNVTKEVALLGPFPNMVNNSDDDEGDEIQIVEQSDTQSNRENFPPPSPSSSTTSQPVNAPEVVLVLPDEDGQEKEYRGPNRNAIMAKLNRQRKKKRMAVLEESVEKLLSENKVLKAGRVELTNKVKNLEAEVEYLKGVLANQSELAGLLNNIKATKLSFYSSVENKSFADKNLSLKDSSRKKRPALCKMEEQKSKKARKDSEKKSLQIKTPVCLETIKSRPSRHATRRSTSEGTIFTRSALYEASLRDKNQTTGISTKSEVRGVCLHVKNKKVSLEFCRYCSQRAEAVFQEEDADPHT